MLVHRRRWSRQKQLQRRWRRLRRRLRWRRDSWLLPTATSRRLSWPTLVSPTLFLHEQRSLSPSSLCKCVIGSPSSFFQTLKALSLPSYLRFLLLRTVWKKCELMMQ